MGLLGGLCARYDYAFCGLRSYVLLLLLRGVWDFPAYFFTVYFDATLYVMDAAGHHICTHLSQCWHGYNGYLDATFHIMVLVPNGLTLYAKVAGNLRQASQRYSDSTLFMAALVPAGMLLLAVFAAIFVELGRYPILFPCLLPRRDVLHRGTRGDAALCKIIRKIVASVRTLL